MSESAEDCCIKRVGGRLSELVARYSTPLLLLAFFVNIVYLIYIACFSHPLDETFTLSLRYSYSLKVLASGLALAVALLANRNNRLLRGLLILAIELFLAGITLELLSYF